VPELMPALPSPATIDQTHIAEDEAGPTPAFELPPTR
jgi:hypothetical protein